MSNIEWLIEVGQCLVCGGRGGWSDLNGLVTTCGRCEGNGRDPARNEPWYQATIAPIQRAVS